MKSSASKLLRDLITPERRARIEQVLQMRTRFVTVVLDNLYHPHNMSAVVRTCEALGIQDIHAIERENRFDPSHGIAMGAQRWITVNRHPSADECVKWLKNRGYLLLAADPPDRASKTRSRQAFVPETVPMDQGPVALAFGKELDGLNPHLRKLCDATLSIPMNGFTESLNVSVTAAICLHELRKRLESMDRSTWELSAEEKACLRDEWYVKSVRHGPKVLEELVKK